MEREKATFEIEFFERVLRRCPDYAEVVEVLGGLYTRQGRIDDGLKMDRKLVRLEPENPYAHYNLACSLALKNRQREALRKLREAINRGYNDREWLLRDPDMESLRHLPEFRKLAAALKPEP